MNRTRQNGYVLYTVVVMLAIVAATVLLVSNDSSSRLNASERDVEATRADYVAEAAMQHAIWHKDNYGCVGDATIPNTSFGPDAYSATIASVATSNTTYSNLSPDRDAWIKQAIPGDNFGSESELAVKNTAGDSFRALYHYDLSAIAAGSTVQSATAWFYLTLNDDQGAVEIFSVTADWAENAVTWSNIATSVDLTVMGTIPQQVTNNVWVSVDATALAQQWINDPPSNHGITLIATSSNKESRYSSREYGSSQKPYLEITTAVGKTSPVNITATSTLASGVLRTLTRTNVPAYKIPVVTPLRPDSVKGVDTHISELSPTTNYGTVNDFWVSSETGKIRLGLLKFKLDTIPTGVRVLSAKLSVRQTSASDPNVVLTAHRIYSDWNEGFATWNQRDDGVNWITPGGDYDSTIIATTEVGVPAIGRFEWDIAELLEGWLNGAYPNYGVALRTVEANIVNLKFDTSDHADNTRAPILTIEYACECGTACLAPSGSGNVLMVIGDSPANPSAGDTVLRDRVEGWGYSVSFIQDNDSLPNFNSAAALNDAAFISTSVDSGFLGLKLENTLMGVVNAEGGLNDPMGISNSFARPVGDQIDIDNVSHYITSVFPTGSVFINRASMEGLTTFGGDAPGADVLATWGTAGAVVAVDAGDGLLKNKKATGRRVMVPLGREGKTNLDYWTNSGSLIVQRALAWATAADVAGRRLLMVVDNSANLSLQNAKKVSLFESWGYSVKFIRGSESQGDFNIALSINDVVFLSEDTQMNQLGSKLNGAEIGVVAEEPAIADDFGFSSTRTDSNGTQITVDNSHFISSPLLNGPVSVLSSSDQLFRLTGTFAPDIQTIGTTGISPALAALEAGAKIINDGIAAGRRVWLPWGTAGLDTDDLTADSLTLLHRAIRWAADSSGTQTNRWYLTTEHDATLGGLSFTDVDVVEYVPWSDTATLLFDGGPTTLSEDIDALHILANGSLLLSSKGNAALGGLNFKKGDLVRYDMANDKADLIFDGETLFGDNKAKITSVHVLENRHLVLSTDKAQTLGGLSFTDRDLVEYDRETDTAIMFFDGSTTTLNSKITGVQVLPNGHLVLSTKDSATLGGLSFAAADLIDYDPVSDTAEMLFDGSELLSDPNEKLFSVHIGQGSGTISWCEGTFRDEFNAVSFSGSDGTLEWTDDWIDVGEDDGPDSGDIRVKNDDSNYQLRTKDNDYGGSGVEREADLRGSSSATLSYVYRRKLKGANDYTKIEIRDGNTALPWTELARHQGPANDGSYQTANHDITSFTSSRTQIRLITASTMGGKEEVYFDDIQILCVP